LRQIEIIIFLEQTEIPAKLLDYLCTEITETSIMNKLNIAEQPIATRRRLFSFFLPDFLSVFCLPNIFTPCLSRSLSRLYSSV